MSSGPSSSTNSARDSAPDSNSVDRDISSLFARLEIPNSLSEEFHGNGNRGSPQPDGSQEESLAPSDMPDCTKEWHNTVTKNIRHHLVGMLVKAIFPDPTREELINGNLLKDLVAYARGVEKEMFDTANDRDEYYHLLSEKIYKLQKEHLEAQKSRPNMGAPPMNENVDSMSSRPTIAAGFDEAAQAARERADYIYKIQRELLKKMNSRLSTQGAAPHDRNTDGSMGASS
ncbi:hypothetical protein B9Z55_011492 [Caenorhabditis nigoni]|uniref:histone acetyltransferase n=1 Tax=Caenorhabditis nigoni TaxID=1611254 RepID=A0A2G5UKC0_9PELO|nr:hypothetical protein B9Z55_011492 [Caenorhabditis nigoni]